MANKTIDKENFDVSSGIKLPEQIAETDDAAVTSYNSWLEAEVRASIDDPDPGVPHDEAMRQIRAAVFAD